MATQFPTFRRLANTLQLEVYDRHPWRISPITTNEPLSSKQRTLLRMLSTAVRERQPYADTVTNLSLNETGIYQRRLRRLAKRLVSGAPLANALEQTRGVLSPEQTVATRFGSELGVLSETFRMLLGDEGTTQANLSLRFQQLGCYLGGVILCALPILFFLCVSIFPSYQAIFSDFDISTPTAFDWLVSISQGVANYWYVLVLLAVILGWLFFTTSGWRYFHRVWLPRISVAAAELRSAEVLSLLAIAVQAGRPAAGAISTLARYFDEANLRQKLLFIRNEHEQGAQLWESMHNTGLITSPEVAALDTAMDNPSLAWTLRRLAALRRQRASERVQRYSDLLQPGMILMLGGCVLFIAYGSLSPLFHLISALT